MSNTITYVFLRGRYNTVNAAEYLGISIETLRLMRREGTGPRFSAEGEGQGMRFYYNVEDLDAWRKCHPTFESIAEYKRYRATLKAVDEELESLLDEEGEDRDEADASDLDAA